jgi:hypothetical protein
MPQNEALRLAPNAAIVLDNRALVHLKRDELDKAIADYDAQRERGSTCC